MASVALKGPLSPDEYLAGELQSPTKHEYVRGEVFAMSGTTDAHNDVAGNLCTRVRAHLRGRGCRAYMAEVNLRVEAANAFFYPDVFVTCDARDLDDPLAKRAASLVIEVLSDSTAEYDRGDKFADYAKLADLREYLLVDARVQRLELYRRNAQGRWEREWVGPEGAIRLESIELTLSLAEIDDDTRVPVGERVAAG